MRYCFSVIQDSLPIRVIIVLLSSMYLLSLFRCGYDSTPLRQHVSGTWEMETFDGIVGDSTPAGPSSGVILELTAHGTFTKTFRIGHYVAHGEYSINDPSHITFKTLQSPDDKHPRFTYEFQFYSDTLVLTSTSREVYRRVQP